MLNENRESFFFVCLFVRLINVMLMNRITLCLFNILFASDISYGRIVHCEKKKPSRLDGSNEIIASSNNYTDKKNTCLT